MGENESHERLTVKHVKIRATVEGPSGLPQISVLSLHPTFENGS